MDARRGNERKLVIDAVGDREVVITRSLAAPRQLVFDAWTKPDQVPRWCAGNGWSMPVCQIDLRVGGAWRYILHGPQGLKMGIKGVYQEIAAPDRLVTTESYDDGEGGPLTGRLEMFTGESINTLTLVERNGVTTASVQVLYPDRQARDRVLGGGMEHGYAEAFDLLDRLLATRSPWLSAADAEAPGRPR